MDGIDWAASAMSAARARLDISTTNLANVSSDGFRKVVARGALTAHGAAIVSQRSSEHGGLRRTGRDYDIAIVGDGAFRVRNSGGAISTTRNGAFTRAADGSLRTDAGAALLGLRGPVRVPDGAKIDDAGRVMLAGKQIDRIIVGAGASLRTGFLESANVNAIDEMVNMLAAQRSFESAEKVVSAIDQTRQKASNDIARLK
jgi:flagellar basal-body rod protein FlgF